MNNRKVVIAHIITVYLQYTLTTKCKKEEKVSKKKSAQLYNRVSNDKHQAPSLSPTLAVLVVPIAPGASSNLAILLFVPTHHTDSPIRQGSSRNPSCPAVGCFQVS